MIQPGRILSFFLLVTLVLFSCGTEEKTVVVDQSFEKIHCEFGLLDVGIGDSPEKVLEKKGAPERKENDELIYTGKLENGVPYTQYVNIDEGEVYEITLDIFPTSDSLLQDYFDALVLSMDDRFQKSRPAPGFATWKTASPGGRLIEVSLVDESMENGLPLIMLNFLENYERTFTTD